MRLAEAWRVALDALRANRLRSGLTMLGVIIGVAAVVVLVAIGTGAKNKVTEQIQGLGSNLVFIVPGEGFGSGGPSVNVLTLDDMDLVARVVGDPERVAASVAGAKLARVGTNEATVTVQGVTASVGDVLDREVARGEYLRDTDVDTRRRVVVVGASTAERLFGDRDPLGRQLSIAGVRFRVIGVFERVGATFGVDRDLDVHIPITAAQRLFATDRVDGLLVKAPDVETIDDLGERIVATLEERYPDEPFSAVTQDQILGVVGEILGLLTGVLAAIAGISLLVGGVGVSNIMLVSVRERTREIGLRKAVGARQRDVLLQFLIEAVLLTSIGGLIGIAIGAGGSLALAAVSPVPAVISWWSPLLAFTVSAAVGVFFGVVPARRAGRLEPVTALRTE